MIMKSFELHFNKSGEVIINNIKGIPENSDECLMLTKPYEHNLGVPIVRVMQDNTVNVDINENA